MPATKIEQVVQSKYGAVAESGLSSGHAGVRAVAEAFGYSGDELASIPAEARWVSPAATPTGVRELEAGRDRRRSRLRRRDSTCSSLRKKSAPPAARSAST